MVGILAGGVKGAVRQSLAISLQIPRGCCMMRLDGSVCLRMPLERLHKIMAHAGIGSRRQCEELIAQGRVTVDGETVTELGHKVDPERADVQCDGLRLKVEPGVYYLVNKPRGVVCTSSRREGRTRAIDLVRHDCRRLYTVGRLDADSRGLIVLTNDGELTQQLTHPRHKAARTYRVRVRGVLSPQAVDQLRQGVFLSNGRTALPKVRVLSRKRGSTELEVELRQGINRQIRRVLAKVGHPVADLQRVAIGPIRDPDLKEGAYRRLLDQEVQQLRQGAQPATPRRRRK